MDADTDDMPTPLRRWHEIVRDRDLSGLHGLLAEDARFHSPIVHRPQTGRVVTAMYLSAACQVLLNDSFRYVREVLSGHHAVLEFMVEIDGVEINGVDMIRWNENGQIDDFKVMIRPLKAIELIHRKMREMLESSTGA